MSRFFAVFEEILMASLNIEDRRQEEEKEKIMKL
jgi:hypothetical protein